MILINIKENCVLFFNLKVIFKSILVLGVHVLRDMPVDQRTAYKLVLCFYHAGHLRLASLAGYSFTQQILLQASEDH